MNVTIMLLRDYSLQCTSLTVLLLFVVLDIGHLGNALKGNPGYLKLRRVRAAQLISNAVRVQNFIGY